jgi:hypothetical protein
VAKRLVFGDLGPKFAVYPVESPDGDQYELRIKIMTEADVNAVNAGVDEPQPPVVHKFVSKEKGYQDEKNFEDEAYKKAVSEAGRLRMYRLLASAVDLEIPGDTIAAKAEALQKEGIPAWLLAKAVRLINQSLGMATEEIEKRVESFQS